MMQPKMESANLKEHISVNQEVDQKPILESLPEIDFGPFNSPAPDEIHDTVLCCLGSLAHIRKLARRSKRHASLENCFVDDALQGTSYDVGLSFLADEDVTDTAKLLVYRKASFKDSSC